MTQSGQATYFRWNETTPNTIPTGPGPTGVAMRITSDTVKVLPQITDSPEITAGNEPADGVISSYEGGGDYGIAWSSRNFDDFIAALLWNDWAWQTGNGTNYILRASGAANVTWDAATRTLTTSATWTVTPSVGDKVLVQGSGNPYLDGIHRIDSSTSTTMVFEEDGILSNAARVPNITSPRNITVIRGERITNSLTPTRKSIGVEKRVERVRGTYLGSTATGGAPVVDYTVLTEVTPQRIQLQATGDAPWTGQINVRASRQISVSAANGGTTVMAGTTPWQDTPIFQGANSVKKCRFYFPDMSAVAGNPGKIEDTLRLCPQSLSLELANNLQVEPLMCADTEFDFQQGEPLGQAQVTGIYETPYPLVAFEKQYAGVFEVALVATNGDGYLFRFPRAKMTLASADVTGRATTIAVSMTVKAFRQNAAITGDSARAVEIYRFQQP